MRLVVIAFISFAGCGARTELRGRTDVDGGTPDGGTPRVCPGSPSTPTQVATLDVAKYFGPAALVVVGAYAYVALSDGDTTGEIVRVSLADGTMNVVDTTFQYAPLIADTSHVYFSPGPFTDHTVLTSLDVVTSQLDTVPMPSAPANQYFVNGYAATPSGVMWLESAQATSTTAQVTYLERWDGAQSTTLTTISQFGSDVVVGTTDAFVLGGDAKGEYFTKVGLYRVPLSGAPATQMKSFITYESPMLIGTIGNDVVYTPDGVAILRTGDAGDTTLVDKAYVSGCESSVTTCQHRRVWMDDTWVYYLGAVSGISRVNLDTSNNELFVGNDSVNAPGAMTTDACNLYWLTSDYTEVQPVKLFMKGR